jgi:hypothetical protein
MASNRGGEVGGAASGFYDLGSNKNRPEGDRKEREKGKVFF